MNEQPIVGTLEPSSNQINFTYLVYGLQVLGLFTVVGFIAAVIVNYIKLPEVKNTWLDSHFRWQIRTFWFGLLWSIIGGILCILLVGYLVLFANYVWVIYRIIKGCLYLNDKREIVF